EWYGGSEHATPGHEHAEVNRLLSDAAKGKIDAVHVSHPDRWSRDNAKSKQGLEILRKHKVRFFVGTQEFNLHDPTACLFLGMSAEIGEFQANNQSQKSMKNRIDRAKEGKPVSGRLAIPGATPVRRDRGRVVAGTAVVPAGRGRGGQERGFDS